jgi:hypothetical protein
MSARLNFLILFPFALVLVGCANHPNVSRDSLFSPNAGSTVNTFRGKIYFGSATSTANLEGIEFTQLVIAPDAVPFLRHEPIILSTNQNGSVAIRTDSSGVIPSRGPVQSSSIPDLLRVGELLSDFPQCAPSEPLSTQLSRLTRTTRFLQPY